MAPRKPSWTVAAWPLPSSAATSASRSIYRGAAPVLACTQLAEQWYVRHRQKAAAAGCASLADPASWTHACPRPPSTIGTPRRSANTACSTTAGALRAAVKASARGRDGAYSTAAPSADARPDPCGSGWLPAAPLAELPRVVAKIHDCVCVLLERELSAAQGRLHLVQDGVRPHSPRRGCGCCGERTRRQNA
jgi:hypothetical protein